jgi:hypothetical protein
MISAARKIAGANGIRRGSARITRRVITAITPPHIHDMSNNHEIWFRNETCDESCDESIKN